jgi:FKBP-type peptidyl-prolyl cis-trans isomerase FkpA
MKGMTIAALAAGFLAANLCAADPAPKGTDKAELTSSKQKISYAIGVNIGKNMKQQNVELDFDVIAKGMKDGAAGTSAFNEQEMTEVMNNFKKEMETKMAEVGTKSKKQGEDFLAGNKSKEGVKVTPSGLQYKVLKEGKGAKPKATDVVKVHYRGTLVDGTEFDSSYKRGEPIEFPLNGVIKGWTEGVQLMTPGSKYQFFIPYDLAYGEEGRPPTIPGSSALIFEVELLEAKPAGAPGGLDLTK